MRRIDDIAALLRSTAIKKRLEGVTSLADLLNAQGNDDGDDDNQLSAESLTALIPDVLPCLRDHNSKVVSLALESLEVMLANVPEQIVQAYFKVLWLNLVEKLGDSKVLHLITRKVLQVREKAVDVVVQLTSVLDVATVFDRLLTLHCIWRCLEQHNLFHKMKDEVLSHIIRLLEDSAKEVRDAAIETLAKFYSHIGQSLLRDLESKNIRSAHMKTLTDRFKGVQGSASASFGSSRAPHSSASSGSSTAFSSEVVPAPTSSLTSILSSYDLPVSSSSSMARYLESIRKRELDTSLAAKASAAALAGDAGDEFSPSQSSTTSTKSDKSFNDPFSQSGVSEKDIQREVAAVYEQLHLDNNWSKRVDGLKSLQQLAQRCSRASDSALLTSLTQAIKTVRERLCEQVADLRSSVSREACQTIQLLAKVLRDEFNMHAEYCLGTLLKATYVTIQVISTAADTCIRGVIESTKNGYVRFITKLLEGAKSRNQVLRLQCVSYLTLTLQLWSVNHLSKHTDLFLVILPAILHDALAEVRAQSRKCFWAFQRVFPSEGDNLFDRLDASTQKNLRDDRTRASEIERNRQSSTVGESSTTASETGARTGVRKLKSSRSLAYEASAASSQKEPAQPSVGTAQRVLQHSLSDVSGLGAKQSSGSAVSGPRRVLGSSSQSASENSRDAGDGSRFPARVLSQGALRVGVDSRAKVSSFSEDIGSDRKKYTPARPLRVLSTSETTLTSKTAMENLYSSRQDQQSSSAGFHASSQLPAKPKRIQIATEATPPSQNTNRADQENEANDRAKRVAGIASLSPRTSGGQLQSLGSGISTITRSDASATSKTAAAPPAPPTSQPGKQRSTPALAFVSDKLEEAISSLGSSSWSVRLDAVEYIGNVIQRRIQQQQQSDTKLDDRILLAFIKHMSDAHYRVAQSVLKNFLSLLQSATQQQLQPQLKIILPKLFQKQIETKESIRVVAKENLDYIANTFDASALANIVIPLLMDGGNMKVKAAVCHYLRALLPGADAYMRQSNNNNHMRSFLGKMAQLLESEMPVSVTSACGELIQVAAKLYSSEMEAALPLLPPTKRTILSKLLKSKGIILNLNSSQSSIAEKFASSNSSRGSVQEADNQVMEAVPERSSRKRSESPNANSASPQRTIQKRKSADENQKSAAASSLAALATYSKSSDNMNNVVRAADSSAPASAPKPSVPFDELLDTLAENNSTERERRTALHKILGVAKSGGSQQLWDKYFGRLLFLLLDAGAEKDVTALKVLQGLIEMQPGHAHGYVHPILLRLLECLGDKVDVASHITENILCTLVSTTKDPEQILDMLSPFISSSEPPVLQVVLRLVKVALELCERVAAAGQHPRGFFLREEQWLSKVLLPVALKLAHSSSDVRKSSVNCVVAFHFAINEDPELMWGYLSDQVDATKKKLVQIFIERAKLERRQAASMVS